MLYDYTDFARVLQTLSKLSNCEVAKSNKRDIEGFPQRLGRSNSTLNVVRTSGPSRSQNQVQEEEIYRTLANDVDEDTYQGY